MIRIIGGKNNQSGYAIAALLIFMVIATTVMAGWMKLSMSSTRTVHANKVRTVSYGAAEGSLNTALSWLRANSQHMTKPLFGKDNFCSKFDRYANATYSTNDPATNNFPVATRIKVHGTNDSPLLVKCTGASCAGLGTSAYPNSLFSGTTSTFNTVGQFAGLNIGNNLVKVTLVDAVPRNEGPGINTVCGAGALGTDFVPVYRIDAMTGNDAGSRVFGYVSGSLSYSQAIGFYGRDRVGIGKPCASDQFTGSTPNSELNGPNQGIFNANCHVGSEGPIDFTNNWKSKIYGSATSTCESCTVDTANVCDTYPPIAHACASEGDSCVGSSCVLPDPFAGLDNPFDDARCLATSPAALGNITTSPDTEYYSAAVSGANYNNAQQTLTLNTQGCYGNVYIPSNKKLNLTGVAAGSPPSGYWIQNFFYGGGGGKAGLAITPNPNNGKIEIHINKFGNEPTPCLTDVHINGNNDLNISNAFLPSQLKIVYWGTCHLIFLGNSDAAVTLYAPNAAVTVKGNSDYYGAIFAKELDFSDLGGSILYDESLGGEDLTDTKFKLRNLEETYR